MARENKLEERCRLLVESMGGKLFKWRSPGNKGVPDRIVLLPGFVAFVEFKITGRPFQPLQEYWQKWLKERGHKAYVIYTYEDFKAVLGL